MFITFEICNASIILKATDIEKIYLVNDSNVLYIYFKNKDDECFCFNNYTEARTQFNSIMKQMGCSNV